MAEKEKIFVPVYRCSQAELYLLLRLEMETSGRKSINGVKQAFFEPDTYKNGEKLVKTLVKKKLLEKQGDSILIAEGLKSLLQIVTKSSGCMNFQNALLQNRKQILSFYYADGQYAGVLQDEKESVLVSSGDPEAIYNAYIKIIEAKGISQSFRPDRWKLLWNGDGIDKPVQEAMYVHSRNREDRERFTAALIADKREVQIIRGRDSTKFAVLERKTASVKDWYGIFVQELERLKQGGSRKSEKGQTQGQETGTAAGNTEYQKVIRSPGFPGSGAGFVFWSLKRFITGIPAMVVQMLKKKAIAPLMYVLWGGFLMIAQLYITCYLNDTFMLERKARWGGLSPYIMVGTLQTPSDLNGFQLNWGNVDTVFLVWPMLALLTLIGRHLLLQIKNRRLYFVSDLLGSVAAVGDCRRFGYGTGRSKWITLGLTWLAGFFIMNPITLFLAAFYSFLLFAQGSGAGFVQFAFLWACASGRKKIDAGLKKEPDSRRYRIVFYNIFLGFLTYALASLAVWFLADYYFWIRLVVTVLMIAFAAMQAFWSGMMPGKRATAAAKIFWLVLAGSAVCAVCLAQPELALADDGGWSESGGTLAGLLQNAGFSTILGLTALTIGLALGGPIGWVVAGSLILGGGTFITGLTDTAAGDYVRKTSRQYFFGPKDGESKTALCTATEMASFIAGFMNPAGLAGTADKVYKAGKVASDAVSLLGNAGKTGVDIADYINGTGDVNAGDLLWDAIGLGLDICGLGDSISDAKKAFGSVDDLQGDVYKAVKDQGFMDKYEDIGAARKTELSDLEADINMRREAELDIERARHNAKIESMEESLNKVKNGEPGPWKELDIEINEKAIRDAMAEETRQYTDKMSEIWNKYTNEQMEKSQEIVDKYAAQEGALMDELAGEMADKGYKIKDFYDKMKESFFPGDDNKK